MEAIYEQFFKTVYRFSLSLCGNESLAEEITAETFFRTLRSLDTFRGDIRTDWGVIWKNG